MTLSVIIPVYNLEKYIATAIESVLAQTYPNVEIIIVNDGSTDGTRLICEDYANRYSQITLINQDNSGAAVARNSGVAIAKGEYITFLDGDDEFGTDDTLEINIKYLIDDKELDIVQFPIKQVDIDSQELIRDSVLRPELLIDSEEMYLRGRLDFLVTNNSCSKIYKSNVFTRQLFEVGRLCEDAIFNSEISSIVNKVFLSNKGFYKYNIRPNSVMTSKRTAKFYIDDLKYKKVLFTNSFRYKSLHPSIINNSARLIKLYFEMPSDMQNEVLPHLKASLPNLSVLRGCTLNIKIIARSFVLLILKILLLTVKKPDDTRL